MIVYLKDKHILVFKEINLKFMFILVLSISELFPLGQCWFRLLLLLGGSWGMDL